ncbi:MAG: hypothetical protein Q4E57_04985 [Eubacteriales bacterium]|nr:hypothetical protein [Eubacteriales bacterium]
MKKLFMKLMCGVMTGVLLSGCAAQTTTGTDSDTAQNEPIDIAALSDNVYLDYAQAISKGIYGWTLSEDGSYYMLSAVNEDGTPLESTAQQNFMGGGQGGMRGGEGKPDGAGGKGQKGGAGERMSDRKQNFTDVNRAANPDDPLAMENNQQASKISVNAQGVYTESNITNVEYQTMLVFVPAEYMMINEDGSASFTDVQIGEYTAQTAPIVFQNNNGGWRSGSPKAPEYAEALSAGMIYVSCGSRSRDAVSEDGTITGKAPTPVADLKAGVIALRANTEVIPGDKDKIISVGASGGGQMSSALGATGNMEEYYPYLYEAGAIGVNYNESTDTYTSLYDDSVYGAMAYCPIADIENADLAYAWMRYDSTLNTDGTQTATTGNYQFSEFQLALQEDAAYAFGEYLNALNLTDSDGNTLSFDINADGTLNLRSGSYYDMTLQNISDSLNATLSVQSDADAYIIDTYGADTGS